MENKTINTFDRSLMMKWIEDMSGFGPRRAGSIAGHKNEDYLVEQLTGFGIENIHKEPIPVTYDDTRKSILEIDEGDGFRAIESFPIPFSAYTSEQGIEGTLVYADPKKFFMDTNWKGKIVLTDICFPVLDVKLISKFSFGKYDPDNTLMDVRHPATWVRLNWHLYKKACEKAPLVLLEL